MTNLLNEKEAAKILGVSVPTLRRWRLMNNTGPTYRKLNANGSVRYAVEDLQRFVDESAVPPRKEAA